LFPQQQETAQTNPWSLVHHFSTAYGRKQQQNIGEKSGLKSFYISDSSRCVLMNDLPLVGDFQNNQLWLI